MQDSTAISPVASFPPATRGISDGDLGQLIIEDIRKATAGLLSQFPGTSPQRFCDEGPTEQVVWPMVVP